MPTRRSMVPDEWLAAIAGYIQDYSEIKRGTGAGQAGDGDVRAAGNNRSPAGPAR
jgi:hypothetical protein